MQRFFHVMGVSFVDQSFGATITQLSEALKGPAPQSVFFANAATLNLAYDDAAYRATLNSASFTFADGTGIRWAARLRGLKLQANLNGTDIVPELIRTNPGVRVYLLGGTKDLIAQAAATFSTLFPDAELVGWQDGYFDHHNSRPVVDRINASKPDLLLVGFGNPLQEQWIAANRPHLRVPLSAGVGGLFSYWAGTLDRAPQIYRGLGMEWLHILMRQPSKWKRYLLGNPRFMLRMLLWRQADMARPIVYVADRSATYSALLGLTIVL